MNRRLFVDPDSLWWLAGVDSRPGDQLALGQLLGRCSHDVPGAVVLSIVDSDAAHQLLADCSRPEHREVVIRREMARHLPQECSQVFEAAWLTTKTRLSRAAVSRVVMTDVLTAAVMRRNI